ncbi:phosphatase PAP2 family protein [Streptomyces sp. TRM66268-LWL]|uniref:Phosphatase PAP2 family protein n=1 Tax=Streptomyces polyasparticus TaxID=2767826 RepID=A0ABR7SAM4_9ACTN|nr:bifunctional glycosyltransferase 87/phosphatase PAP2 family protein [Streptomyces polyasparticus]MBC9712531.1 phosphatase PAP2 family protein [Streptomyces polyasparticus]
MGAGVPVGRTAAARIALWLLAAFLGARQIALVLRSPPGERLIELENWIGPLGVLQVRGSLYDGGEFSGTPFTGLVLKPLRQSAEHSLGVFWTFGTLFLVALIGFIAARALPAPVTRRAALLGAPVAIVLMMLSLPVRDTLHLGQTSIIPVLLVLAGCFTVRGERLSGVLIGIGAALQPTVLLFAPLLWCTGRRRAAVSTAGTFAAATALAWAAMPQDSWTYWVHHLAGAGLGGAPAQVSNQSLHGALLRLGLAGPAETAVFLALGAAVAYLGLRRAVRYARDGQLLLAVALTGCVAVAVSPTAWQHQLLWLLLAAVGRVGIKAANRLVWPAAVVVVMTLPAEVILLDRQILVPLRDNLLLLTALAAACAVPFLTRTSPYFREPVPTAYAAPADARWRRIPLLPLWRRALTRPNLLLELLLIRVFYAAYSQVRLAATAGRAEAEAHGRQILDLERALFLDIEYWLNHLVARTPWLEAAMNFYYTSFHFTVPLVILAVLYRRRPADYRWARSALGLTTVLGLAGFWLYPLAPPRLMPGLGFVDTIHGAQDFTRPDYGAMTALTNQYAAMPSLHFGWSLWCGLVALLLARRWWLKALGLLHPALTLVVIVGTANHWILDAAGGALVVGAGFLIVYVLSGPRRTKEPEPLSSVPEASIRTPS